MIKSRRSSPRLSAKQLQKQEKSNSIQSLLKVTPILNGDRMLLYLPTMRRFDFDSHLLPFQTTNVSSLSRIRRGKRKERDSTDPNPRRENDKEGEEETVAARKKRRCTGKRRERELYCIYRTLGNLHIDLPRKCVIHGSRTSRKQKLILARSWYSGEPIWIGDAGAHTGGGEGWKCEETTAWDGQVNETWAGGGRNLCVEWTEGRERGLTTRQHVDLEGKEGNGCDCWARQSAFFSMRYTVWNIQSMCY